MSTTPEHALMLDTESIDVGKLQKVMLGMLILAAAAAALYYLTARTARDMHEVADQAIDAADAAHHAARAADGFAMDAAASLAAAKQLTMPAAGRTDQEKTDGDGTGSSGAAAQG